MFGKLGTVLLRVAGGVLLVAAVAGVWFASGEQEAIPGQTANINISKADRGQKLSVEKADERIAEAEAAIEGMTKRMYLWYGAAAAFLVVGVFLLLWPSPKKRKAPASEPPPA